MITTNLVFIASGIPKKKKDKEKDLKIGAKNEEKKEESFISHSCIPNLLICRQPLLTRLPLLRRYT